jgi:hypothetical protein
MTARVGGGGVGVRVRAGEERGGWRGKGRCKLEEAELSREKERRLSG